MHVKHQQLQMPLNSKLIPHVSTKVQNYLLSFPPQLVPCCWPDKQKDRRAHSSQDSYRAKRHRKTFSPCDNPSKPTTPHEADILHVSHTEMSQSSKNSSSLPSAKVFQKQYSGFILFPLSKF